MSLGSLKAWSKNFGRSFDFQIRKDLLQPKQYNTEFYFPYCVYVELSVLVEVIRVCLSLMYGNDAVRFVYIQLYHVSFTTTVLKSI